MQIMEQIHNFILDKLFSRLYKQIACVTLAMIYISSHGGMNNGIHDTDVKLFKLVFCLEVMACFKIRYFVGVFLQLLLV